MKWLNRTLVYSPIHYGLCKSEKEFNKELKRGGIAKKDRPNFLKETHSLATVHFFYREKVCAILCIGDMKDREQEEIYSLIVHESVHIWQEIKNLLGEGNPSIEFEAYSLQNISKNLFDAYKKK